MSETETKLPLGLIGLGGYLPVAAFVMGMVFYFSCQAEANDVWIDFTSDFHDGANGPPNGVADWIEELNQATADAGVPQFSVVERSMIESTIVSQIDGIFADYDLTFVISEPAGEHDVVYMARDNDHPDVSSTNLGSAPVDIGNQDTNGYTTRSGNPSGVAKVTPGNFGSSLEQSDTRSRQITEIATSLAGTAAHELAHTFGLLHHYTYSAVGITPSNYLDTGSLQNQHLLATGSTGISETERERVRSLSPFSRVMLDITGGSNASVFEENNSIVVGGLTSDRSEDFGGDAGDTLASAWPLGFEIGPTSGLPISFLEADLDGSSLDNDIYRFETPTSSLLTAHVFSERLDLGSDEFDAVLTLLDETGGVLFESDDPAWDDDHYLDFASPEDEEDDPFLVNIPLDAGVYYLRVAPATNDVSDAPNVGDNYWLITTLDLEPPVLQGDYNGSGSVDAADYAVWRNSLGSPVALPFDGPDGSGDGRVGPEDYELWVQNFGATHDGLVFSATPEPNSLATLAGLVAGVAAVRRRSRRRILDRLTCC